MEGAGIDVEFISEGYPDDGTSINGSIGHCEGELVVNAIDQG